MPSFSLDTKNSFTDHLLHNFRKRKICIRNTQIHRKCVGLLGSIGYAGSLKLFYTKSVNEFFVSAEKLALVKETGIEIYLLSRVIDICCA